MTSSSPAQPPSTHDALIEDQFTRQAELFAASPALHNEETLTLLVNAAEPKPSDESLDVACGPGSVVAAFAARVRRSVGIDATEAMLDQARKLASERSLKKVEWHRGDAYALPFPDAAFDIVSCRFAFHHLEEPSRALAEMIRVARPGGRIVVCDGLASDDPRKADAFNAMERHRDPSTVAFRPLSALLAFLSAAGLPKPTRHTFRVTVELEKLIAASFPAGDDRDRLRRMIEDSIDGDKMGLGTSRENGKVTFSYLSAILVSPKV